MVSRDTVVHVFVASLAIVLLVLADVAGLGLLEGATAAVVFIAFYGVILGGAHLVLAILGEDGMIPVEARWRYVAALAVVLVGTAMVAYGGSSSIGPLEISTLGYALVGITAVAYVVVEGLAGYRDTRPQAENRS
ncbi:hypothetical protein [Natronosalvus vescus]|uniref:hypothetical protein n=1 Tax=Natronosalvus vescus TaxID=2953881 RepID=UPI0020908362|nr:hypothetical protein [Natronosalvus vescus]